jgi:RHS repeat-associated protein
MASYSQSSTTHTVATALAAAITGSGTGVTASAGTGGAITVTASRAGTVDNGLTVTLSSASNQPKYFTSASFTGTSGTLSGGEAGTTTPATIYSYSIAGSNQTSGFDTNGNLLSYNDLITGGWTMTYDNVNRLSTGVASSGVWNSLTLGWMYDSFGNRKTQTPGGNPNAPVPPAQTLTYLPGHNKISNWGSDQAGNITSDGIHQYAYDSEGRVCAVSYFNTGESAFMAYVYDAEGRRVAKGSTNGLNCNMAANDFTLMEQSILGLSGESVSQLDGSGNFLRSNVYANGQLLATYNNNSAYFSFGDWLGSKRVVANPTGTVAEMCMNLPFGDDLICSANDPSQHHFTGQLHDLETGNDYFNARYYGNSSGRFLSPDLNAADDDLDPVPYANLNDPQSLNLYAYVRNNPLSRKDGDGHSACDTGNTGPDGTFTFVCTDNLANPDGTLYQLAGTLGVGFAPETGGASLGVAAGFMGAAFCAQTNCLQSLINLFSKESAPPNTPTAQPASPTGAKPTPRPTPNFVPPTNPPQDPPTAVEPGHNVRVMPPTAQYPNGYWVETNQNNQPINPATGRPPSNVTRPEARAQTHVPLPPPTTNP